jgi:hypothetical protein
MPPILRLSTQPSGSLTWAMPLYVARPNQQIQGQITTATLPLPATCATIIKRIPKPT